MLRFALKDLDTLLAYVTLFNCTYLYWNKSRGFK